MPNKRFFLPLSTSRCSSVFSNENQKSVALRQKRSNRSFALERAREQSVRNLRKKHNMLAEVVAALLD